jgi:hypothetical protein
LTGDAVRLAFFNLLLLAAGIGVTAVAGWWRRPRAMWRAIGVSYLSGVAAFGVLAQLLYVCGASLSRATVAAICLVLACGSVVGLRGEGHVRVPRDPWRLAAIPLAAFIVLIAIDLWYQPLWAYDSWTFWTPKAHALWALGGLDAGWFTQADLTSRDYPILLPSIEAAGFRFTGYETGLLDLQSLVFLVAFLRAIYELTAGRARSVVLWAVLSMVVVAPTVVDQLASAEADIPVAVLFATAGAFGALWLRDRRPPALALSALLAAGASATKVEGLGFTLAIFLSLIVVSWRRFGRRAALSPLVAGLCAVAVGVLPWRIWLAVHDVPNQGSFGRIGHAGYLVSHVARLPVAVAYLVAKMIDPRAWLLVLPLFCVVLVVARRSGERTLTAYATSTFVVAFALLVLAYWSTRLGLHYQLATSARRVVTGLMFFAAVLTPLLSDGP